MKNIYRLTYIVLICLSANILAGQNTFQPKQPGNEWKGIVYRKEVAFEFRLHTNGPLLLGVNIGEIKSYYRTDYYHMSLGFMKDPRERNQNKNRANGFESSSSFALGKQNSVIVLRAGIGRKQFISEKAKRKGIAIGYDYEIGPSIAFLKPYYLQLIYSDNTDPPRSVLRTEKYSEENADRFLDANGNTVFGGTSYFTGFGEMAIVPGIQGKLGLFFSLGAFDQKIKTVETGVMFDIYIRKLPIMVETDLVSNRPYFINFYVNLLLGSRKN